MKRPENIKQLRRIKQIRIFSVFLVVTLLFWAFQKLSQTYTDVVSINLELQAHQPHSIFYKQTNVASNVKVKTSGFNLVYLKWFSKTITLKSEELVPFSSQLFYYLPNHNISEFHQQWSKLIQFEKDTIWIQIPDKKIKKVPVKPVFTMQCKEGFKLIKPIRIQPDSVLISGEMEKINSISFIETEPEVWSQINQNFTRLLPLNVSQLKQYDLHVQQPHVKVTGEVARITEKKYEIPIRVIQSTTGKTCYIFPQMATLKVQMTFEQAQRWHQSDFEIACKIPKNNRLKEHQLELYVATKPDDLLYYQIIPASVDYFLE